MDIGHKKISVFLVRVGMSGPVVTHPTVRLIDTPRQGDTVDWRTGGVYPQCRIPRQRVGNALLQVYYTSGSSTRIQDSGMEEKSADPYVGALCLW